MTIKLMLLMAIKKCYYYYIDVITRFERISREKKLVAQHYKDWYRYNKDYKFSKAASANFYKIAIEPIMEETMKRREKFD